MGEIAVVMLRSRPSSELPVRNPKYAVTSTIRPLGVAAWCHACALTCGCHSDPVSPTKAARRRFCGVVSVPAR
ncbi:hypothetical protein SUDANB178_00101 [Streptomyces sp. enrichment culture]